MTRFIKCPIRYFDIFDIPILYIIQTSYFINYYTLVIEALAHTVFKLFNLLMARTLDVKD